MIDVAKCYRVSEVTKCYKLRCALVQDCRSQVRAFKVIPGITWGSQAQGPQRRGRGGRRQRGARGGHRRLSGHLELVILHLLWPASVMSWFINILNSSIFTYLMLAATSPVLMTVLCRGEPPGDGESTPWNLTTLLRGSGVSRTSFSTDEALLWKEILVDMTWPVFTCPKP